MSWRKMCRSKGCLIIFWVILSSNICHWIAFSIFWCKIFNVVLGVTQNKLTIFNSINLLLIKPLLQSLQSWKTTGTNSETNIRVLSVQPSPQWSALNDATWLSPKCHGEVKESGGRADGRWRSTFWPPFLIPSHTPTRRKRRSFTDGPWEWLMTALSSLPTANAQINAPSPLLLIARQ